MVNITQEDFCLVQFNALTPSAPEKVYQGTVSECQAKFHRLCPFSFANHTLYSYTTYTVMPFSKWEKMIHERQ